MTERLSKMFKRVSKPDSEGRKSRFSNIFNRKSKVGDDAEKMIAMMQFPPANKTDKKPEAPKPPVISQPLPTIKEEPKQTTNEKPKNSNEESNKVSFRNSGKDLEKERDLAVERMKLGDSIIVSESLNKINDKYPAMITEYWPDMDPVNQIIRLAAKKLGTKNVDLYLETIDNLMDQDGELLGHNQRVRYIGKSHNYINKSKFEDPNSENSKHYILDSLYDPNKYPPLDLTEDEWKVIYFAIEKYEEKEKLAGKSKPSKYFYHGIQIYPRLDKNASYHSNSKSDILNLKSIIKDVPGSNQTRRTSTPNSFKLAYNTIPVNLNNSQNSDNRITIARYSPNKNLNSTSKLENLVTSFIPTDSLNNIQKSSTNNLINSSSNNIQSSSANNMDDSSLNNIQSNSANNIGASSTSNIQSNSANNIGASSTNNIPSNSTSSFANNSANKLTSANTSFTNVTSSPKNSSNNFSSSAGNNNTNVLSNNNIASANTAFKIVSSSEKANNPYINPLYEYVDGEAATKPVISSNNDTNNTTVNNIYSAASDSYIKNVQGHIHLQENKEKSVKIENHIGSWRGKKITNLRILASKKDSDKIDHIKEEEIYDPTEYEFEEEIAYRNKCRA